MLLAFPQPLLADLTQVVIGLAVLLIAVLKQIFDANKKAGAKRVMPPAAPQQQPQPMARNVAPAGGQQADPLRSQVEEFLRRAGRPPQGQPRPPQQRPASEIELLVDETPRSSERRPLVESSRRAPRPQPPIKPDKRPARRSVVPKRRVTLAERAAVREETRVGNLAEQPPHLGKRIIEEDKQFDDQLKAKFDHTVGTFGDSRAASESNEAPPQRLTPAAQIAAMLSNPDGVRQAVLINEILRRPSDRW